MGERIKVTANKPLSTKENSASNKQKTGFRSQSSHVDQILFLQRTIGNQAVQRLIKSGTLQAKLKIGQPGDKYEQEADRVADAVMRMPEPGVQRQVEPEEEDETLQAKPLAKEITPLVQRQDEPEEEEEELQAKTTSDHISEANPNLESDIQSLKGGGQPLSENHRTFFESRFGRDFSQVRMHADTRAAESARAVNARAFTVGKDVVFGAGQYAPENAEGKRLLTHELTHVVQQNQHRVSPLEIRRLPKSKSELEGSAPRYSYSDNCGWIDWGHVNPTFARKLIDTVKETSRKMVVKEIPYRAATYHQPKLVYDESCPSRYKAGEKRRSRRDPGSLDIVQHKYGIREYYLSGFEVGKSDAMRFDKFNRTLQKDLQKAASAQNPPFSSPYYISVDGFTDCFDDDKKNLALRKERAVAMKTFLYTGYITKHYSYTTSAHTILKQFISKNDSEEGRRKNRGVLILATPEFTPKGEEFQTPKMTSQAKGFTLTSVKSEFKLHRSLNHRELLGVSLWIFQELTKFFEKEQLWTEAIGHSSFSNEDLPSNLIGFYLAAMDKKPNEVRKIVTPMCDVYDPDDSKMMFELYSGRWKKTRTFIPAGFEDDWPSKFKSITPIPPSKAMYELLNYEGTSNLEWFFEDVQGHRSER